MYSLLIDTHLDSVVIVLYKDGKEITTNEVNSKSGHSEVAMPLIKDVLKTNKINIKDISEIITVIGPGSFTGIRIGVTIAKTLSYTLNIPIKTITSLEIKAVNLSGNKIVAISDKNGKYIGKFNENNILIEDYSYIPKSLIDIKNIIENVEINYDDIYEFLRNRSYTNVHEIKPLYVKKIEVEKWFAMLQI